MELHKSVIFTDYWFYLLFVLDTDRYAQPAFFKSLRADPGEHGTEWLMLLLLLLLSFSLGCSTVYFLLIKKSIKLWLFSSTTVVMIFSLVILSKPYLINRACMLLEWNTQFNCPAPYPILPSDIPAEN